MSCIASDSSARACHAARPLHGPAIARRPPATDAGLGFGAGSRILPASSPVSAPGPRSGRPPMFTAYADVPGSPLVFPLFYGAMAYFALATARRSPPVPRPW